MVVLLTATPHSGDDEGFARLGALGDLEEVFPLTVFRRTRSDVGLPHGRRSILFKVRPTDDEAAVHRVLEHTCDGSPKNPPPAHQDRHLLRRS